MGRGERMASPRRDGWSGREGPASVDAEFLETIRRLESGIYERRLDRRRAREVIDLVSGLLSAKNSKGEIGS